MIRSFLAMLAALAPMATLAQYSPPAQQDPQATPPPAQQPPAQYPPAPPPYPAAPPPAQTAPPPYPWQQQPPPQYPQPPRPPQQRDSWYIGFGIGGGDGNVSGQGQTLSFKDLNVSSPTTAFFNFEAGATLTPQLLLGGEVAVIASSASSGGIDTSVSIANLNLVATFFPMEKGFFVKGGIGRAGLSWKADTGTGTSTFDASGFDLTGGVGYAFWLGRTFNLKLEVDYSQQWYGSSSIDPESSNFWTAYLGLVWY